WSQAVSTLPACSNSISCVGLRDIFFVLLRSYFFRKYNMMLFNCFVLVLIAVEIRAAAIAFENAEDEMYPVILAQVREKRSPFPGRAMMFHGYFGHPHNGYGTHNGRSYDPQGAMTAFAAGDSVSAGSSYYGHGGGYDCSNCGVQKPSNGNDKNGNGFGGGYGGGYGGGFGGHRGHGGFGA
ncbi:hypothetical protein L9F63_027715, partial [Diploptera punctata]